MGKDQSHVDSRKSCCCGMLCDNEMLQFTNAASDKKRRRPTDRVFYDGFHCFIACGYKKNKVIFFEDEVCHFKMEVMWARSLCNVLS